MMIGSNKTILLSFDPGLRGAMSVIYLPTLEAEVYNFPIVKYKVYNTRKKRNENRSIIDTKLVGELIKPYRKDLPGVNEDKEVYGIIEDVSSRSDQGERSIWTFAKSVAVLETYLCTFDIISLPPVRPQQWKKVVIPGYSDIVKLNRKSRNDSHLTEEDLGALKKSSDREIAELELSTAKALFPMLEDKLSLSKDGLTDSLLIGYYGALQLLDRENGADLEC